MFRKLAVSTVTSWVGTVLTLCSSALSIEWSRRLALEYRVEGFHDMAGVALTDPALLVLILPLVGWWLARQVQLTDRISRIATLIAITAWLEVYWLVKWGFEFFDWLKMFVERAYPWSFLGWEEFVALWIAPVLAGLLTYALWKRRSLTNPWEIGGTAFAVLGIWVYFFLTLPRREF